MFVYILVLIFIDMSPAVNWVAKEKINSCSKNEFSCSNGTCISSRLICDGGWDCLDGSDEAVCSHGANSSGLLQDLVLHTSRSKRQASECRKDQWRCRDGVCIAFDSKCDGRIDCPDSSDETHALCRNSKCLTAWFRCTYGACVDGTAPCNGINDCADKSDELLPRCRPTNEFVDGKFFTCLEDNTEIPIPELCDGFSNCPDGTDEILRTCADTICSKNQFQCAYGACVNNDTECNTIRDCADGSDETEELCIRKLEQPTIAPTPAPIQPPTRPPVQSPILRPPVPLSLTSYRSTKCVLPPYPEHGTYIVSNKPTALPGQELESLKLTVTCFLGYGATDTAVIFCQDGTWSQSIPTCVRFCYLEKHPSVNYYCLVSNIIEGRRICKNYELSGTVVRPECNSPNYHTTSPLRFMKCINGKWNYVAVCIPECGLVTPTGMDLVIDGRVALRGELPWHVGIYRKTTTPYLQICGGSLVSSNVVISAAHCFWDDITKQRPPSEYAVAVGKLYRPWNNPTDTDAQKSNVKGIRIPPRFQGQATNFQDDIAILMLETAFAYHTYVRPVCLDFYASFDRRQLQHGNLAKVAGWGLTAENGDASQILRVLDIPYVNIEKCIASFSRGFKEYITSDKICAGYTNGSALCKGDSGGGLAFPETERGLDRYYLRGIVSTAQNNKNVACDSSSLTAFTHLLSHEHFLKEYLDY